MRTFLSMASALTVTLAVGGILGGYAGDGGGSTVGVASNSIPGSDATNSRNTTVRAARGPIGGFGSIIVHGVEYKVRGANLLLPDDNSKPVRLESEADAQKYLDLGMVVNLKADRRGNATEIEFHDTLQGVIHDNGVDFIEVLGHHITVNASTRFSGASGLDDPLLSNGHVVEVSGFVDHEGGLRATFIRSRDDAAASGQEIKGFVVGPPTASNFQLGLAPNAAHTVTVDFTGLTLSEGVVEGAFVEVRTKSLVAAGVLTATAVHLEEEHEPAEMEDSRFDGIVTSGDSGQFFIGGAMVQATDSTVFVGLRAGQVAPGVKLQVEGPFSGGVLVARRIRLEAQHLLFQ